MRAKPQTANRVYEDFDPPTEWAKEDSHDTLIILLPGFQKEQLRIQVTRSRTLKVWGERSLGTEKWRRFEKEFPITFNVDSKGITAKFEGGVLFINHPKVITRAQQRVEAKPREEAPKPRQEPKSEQQAQKGDGENAVARANANNALRKTTEKEKDAKDASGKSDDASKDYRKTEEKGKEPSDANKKKSTSPSADGVSQKTSEKEINSSPEKTGTVTGPSERRETPSMSVKDSAKMDKQGTGNGDAGVKSELEVYNQMVGGWAAALKKSKKLMNLIVAACLILVFVIYLKNAGKPTSQPTREVP